MGRTIAELLRLFRDRIADAESAARVAELAATPDRWLAAHALFREIRSRCLAAVKAKDRARSGQYCFEELCCKAMYNATGPKDPFDPSSSFSVAGAAVRLARTVGVPVEEIADVLAAEP
jgi:hypothetical protein